MRNQPEGDGAMSETSEVLKLQPAESFPVDPAALMPVLAPLGQARTLPAEAYTSARVHQWELERFFEGSWVCAGRASALD